MVKFLWYHFIKVHRIILIVIIVCLAFGLAGAWFTYGLMPVKFTVGTSVLLVTILVIAITALCYRIIEGI